MTFSFAPRPDRDSIEWWAALARHELTLQACDDCGRLRWPARAICNDCASSRWQWVQASGTGTIESWTVTHRASYPDTEVPYVVVLVRLDDQDDIFMPGNWEGADDGTDLDLGRPVAVGYEDVLDPQGQTVSILRWRAR